MNGASAAAGVAAALLVVLASGTVPVPFPTGPGTVPVGPREGASGAASNGSALGNFSGAVDRIVVLVGAAGGGLLAIVWARVALSWFSNDVTKKVQAKDRARDALVGTLLFAAALSGLIWGLAQWVLTGA